MSTLATAATGIPTSVVITIVLACAAIVVTAILALVTRLASSIDRLDDRLTSAMTDVRDEVSALRAGIAGIDSRLTGVERRI